MFPQLRFLAFLVVALTVTCLSGCGSGRSTGRVTYGVDTWSRDVKYSADGPGSITSQKTTATITFSGGKLVIEKDRITLNDEELTKVAEDAKVVEIDYTGGVLTITADGKKVHEGKLRK
jgi:hypothetical protein